MTGRLSARVRVERDGFRLDVALEVAEGRVTALVGRNGAGKSTLLSALAGLTPLDAGRIELDGTVLDDPEQDVLVPAERRPVGFVQQRTALFPHLTVLDNVAFGLRAAGVGRRAAREHAMHLLAEADLADLAARRPREVSGGQAARIALVRTLAREPALLLLDEPLAAVDAEARPELRRGIRQRLAAFAGSAVLVTHDVRDAEALADDVAVLDDGVLVQRGPLAALRADPALPVVARLLDDQPSSTSPA